MDLYSDRDFETNFIEIERRAQALRAQATAEFFGSVKNWVSALFAGNKHSAKTAG